MWIYILIYVIITFLFINSVMRERQSKTLMVATMMFLGVFVGLADMLGGYDRYIYGELFDRVADTVAAGWDVRDTTLFAMYPKELGYDYLNVLIGHFTRNRYIFIFLYTILCYVLILRAMLKYTNRSPFVIVVFMGLWFFFTFTYLRQVLAAAVAWQAIDFAVRRKPYHFFAIALVAASIHNSALLFLPVYFLPQRKFNKIVVVLVMLVCFALGLTGVPEAVTSAFGDAADLQERVADMTGHVDMFDEEQGGFRFEYLLEAAVFLFLILTNYGSYDENNRVQMIMLNMALIFCALLLFFIKSLNGGRLTWLYMIGLIATINQMVTSRRGFNILHMGLLIMFTFLYLRILGLWNDRLYPYKTFLTNGHTAGDWVYYEYEYDPLYDANKFYR